MIEGHLGATCYYDGSYDLSFTPYGGQGFINSIRFENRDELNNFLRNIEVRNPEKYESIDFPNFWMTPS